MVNLFARIAWRPVGGVVNLILRLVRPAPEPEPDPEPHPEPDPEHEDEENPRDGRNVPIAEEGQRQRCPCQDPPNQAEHVPPNFLLAAENRSQRANLFTAALKGDWKAAEPIIQSITESNDGYVNSSVTEYRQTSLHIAAGSKRTDFVKKLVNRRQIDLRLQDNSGNTAFCHAVMAGSIPVAEVLLKQNPELAFIRGSQNSTPLFIAVIFGHHDMARFLYRRTETHHLDHLEQQQREELFFNCIETNMFDIALKLLERYPGLAVARKPIDQETALHLLARKPSAFDSKRPAIVKILSRLCNYKESEDKTALRLVETLWTNFQNITENVREEIRRLKNLLFKAAEVDNYKFLAVILRSYPDFIWETDGENRTIFHIAAMHRQENVFSQIHGIGSIKDIAVTLSIPLHGNPSDNILHLTAMKSLRPEPSKVPGSALQMQRELFWFKEVKSIVSPLDREKKGRQYLTPRQLFSREHKDLLEKAEKWMRETSTACLIVATIITTVVYSAGFSIPGGYSDSLSGDNATRGSPVLINHTLFHVFAVSEAVSLYFSVTSALIFLFILTSRYAEEDFLIKLPLSLIFGLATLFISIMAMVVSFSSAFFLDYQASYNHNKFRWVPIFISTLASLPAASFCCLQFPLLLDVFISTFFRSWFRPKRLFC